MVREVDTFPWEGEYPAASVARFISCQSETLMYTQRFYEVRNAAGELILGAGVALWSFVRPPELWLMLAKPYYVNLRDSLRLTKAALALPAADYEGLVCDVRKDNVSELHFVKHCGWVPTGRPSLRPHGENFIQFEVM